MHEVDKLFCLGFLFLLKMSYKGGNPGYESLVLEENIKFLVWKYN